MTILFPAIQPVDLTPGFLFREELPDFGPGGTGGVAPDSFNLTAGVKWNFAKDKFSLTARCSDIFNSSMPDMKVRFKGQYLDMNSSFYTRTVSLNLTYRFGGYKKQEVKGVDTSRFGH